MVRYGGECRKCGAPIEVGSTAVHERRVGLFCTPCAPTDPEEIRTYRQEGADRKADRYEGWAAKRQERARATLQHNERFTGDLAFNTQPGHMPLRSRVIAQNDRAYESLETARRFTAKADSLRHVRVAGDAASERQAKRDSVLSWLKVGMEVHTGLYGCGQVKKINRKTASVGHPRYSGTVTVDLSWLKPVTPASILQREATET